MTEYSRMAKGTITATGSALVVPLPFQPQSVELTNITQWKATTATAVIRARWSDKYIISGNPITLCDVVNTNTTELTDFIGASGTPTTGISTFSGGQLLQFGPTLVVSAMAKTNPAQVTTSTNHNLTSGDVVVFQGLWQSSTGGCPQINGIPFIVTVTGATTFTINWNTNQGGYNAITGASTGFPTVMKVLFPYLYFPGTSVISAITTGATTTIVTTTAHNLVVGQEVAFRIPALFGTTQLNALPNASIPGSPVYYNVISVTDFQTFVVNVNSTAFTAFNTNFTPTSLPTTFPQVTAIGDVNTGGVQISSGSALYPSPQYNPFGTVFNTINGPGILGAFVNNTSQGFTISANTANTVTGAKLCGAASDLIEWKAYFYDISS